MIWNLAIALFFFFNFNDCVLSLCVSPREFLLFLVFFCYNRNVLQVKLEEVYLANSWLRKSCLQMIKLYLEFGVMDEIIEEHSFWENLLKLKIILRACNHSLLCIIEHTEYKLNCIFYIEVENYILWESEKWECGHEQYVLSHIQKSFLSNGLFR